MPTTPEIRELDTITVDGGRVLIIDPAYLNLTTEQWETARKLGAVLNTPSGDGIYGVDAMDGALFVAELHDRDADNGPGWDTASE